MLNVPDIAEAYAADTVGGSRARGRKSSNYSSICVLVTPGQRSRRAMVAGQCSDLVARRAAILLRRASRSSSDFLRASLTVIPTSRNCATSPSKSFCSPDNSAKDSYARVTALAYRRAWELSIFAKAGLKKSSSKTRTARWLDSTASSITLCKWGQSFAVEMPTWHSRRIASPRDLMRLSNIQSSMASNSVGVIMMGTRWSLRSFSSLMREVLHRSRNLHNFSFDPSENKVNMLCKLLNVMDRRVA